MQDVYLRAIGCIARARNINCLVSILFTVGSNLIVLVQFMLEHCVVLDTSCLEKDLDMGPILEKKRCEHVGTLEMFLVDLFVIEFHGAIEIAHVSHKETEL